MNNHLHSPKTVLYILISFIVLCNCNNPSGKQIDSRRTSNTRALPLAEWTIMVFMNGDNNLEPNAITDFREMAQVGSTDLVNIVTQMDLNGRYMNVGWTQTLRFHVKKGMYPTPQNAVMDIGEANMGDQKVLTDFVTWSTSKYPAKKFALVIWDHGQGYRLFLANKSLAKDVKKYISYNKGTVGVFPLTMTDNVENPNIHILMGDPFRSSSQSPFKSCSNDETDNDELFNREIQNGLLNSLNGKKLDVLGFDACLMGMVETAYAMRNISNNFIGSEELEPGTGWDYTDWLGKLLAKPTMDGQELSKTLVESYDFISGSFSTNTLSAMDISGFGDVALKISTFANSLKNNLLTELPLIKIARNECANYAPNPYNEPIPKDYFFHIDFIRFCDQIIEKTQNVQLKNDAENARSAVAKTILLNYRGDFRAGKFGSNGLAIYFPISNAQYKEDLFEKGGYKKDNTYFPVEFVQNQTWADFLHAYFLKVP